MLNTRDYNECIGSVLAKRLLKEDYLYREVHHKESIRNMHGKYKYLEMVTDENRSMYLPVITTAKASKIEAFFIYGLLCIYAVMKRHDTVFFDIKWANNEDSNHCYVEGDDMDDIILYLIHRYTEFTIDAQYEITATSSSGNGIKIHGNAIDTIDDFRIVSSVTPHSTKSTLSDVTVRTFSTVELT